MFKQVGVLEDIGDNIRMTRNNLCSAGGPSHQASLVPAVSVLFPPNGHSLIRATGGITSRMLSIEAAKELTMTSHKSQ